MTSSVTRSSTSVWMARGRNAKEAGKIQSGEPLCCGAAKGCSRSRHGRASRCQQDMNSAVRARGVVKQTEPEGTNATQSLAPKRS